MNFSKITTLFAMVTCIALLGGIASTQTTSPVASAVKQMSVNGADLVYLEQGKGAQVVFVHGAFSDHRVWEAQREAVAQQYRYIALTQRYFGTAPWPDTGEKYSLTTHADDLAVFTGSSKPAPSTSWDGRMVERSPWWSPCNTRS
jgi:hypothetical protein